MKCPQCRSQKTFVTRSQTLDQGVRRRRECVACGNKFSTIELNCFNAGARIYVRYGKESVALPVGTRARAAS